MRFFYSGGNYNNTTYGVASFNGNNARSNANTNIGFRSALPHFVRCCKLKGLLPVQAVIKGPVPLLYPGQKTYAA